MKSFEVNMVYTTSDDVTIDEFNDWLIEMAEKDGYDIGGGVIELDENGNPVSPT